MKQPPHFPSVQCPNWVKDEVGRHAKVVRVNTETKQITVLATRRDQKVTK